MNAMELHGFLQSGLRQGVFPCYAAAVGDADSLLLCECGGNRSLFPEKQPVTEDTLFDMASLSKLIGTTCAALRLLEEGRLRLSDTADRFFAECHGKERLTVLQLMTHTSGIKAHFPLWLRGIPTEDAADAILREPFGYEPGTEAVYSCMGYILLGKILETVENEPLDRIVTRLVFAPLGMHDSFYCPPRTRLFASTEGELCGTVHDENARFLGGVSGNAGIFCTLSDTVRFAKMLAKSGEGLLLRDTFALALHNYTPGKQENRGLGFQLCSFGYGHTGFTGTSLYVNGDTFAVLLTNRVHPSRENFALAPFRREFHRRVFGR